MRFEFLGANKGLYTAKEKDDILDFAAMKSLIYMGLFWASPQIKFGLSLTKQDY